MLYKLLHTLFRITNRFYFKSLQVKGKENIPKEGPVFFVANHPGAFMDPIVIATAIKRPVFFLAKGILFQSKLMQWLLPKFNMVPIYRSHETPDQTDKNKEVFSVCHQHLAKGGSILAFPEGVSLTDRKIKKIKTGTARICLGAETENNYELDIKIIPIGLNYSDPHSFQSDLFINIDEPIDVSDYYALQKEDPFKAAHALTDEIRKRIEKQVVAIEDASTDELVAHIELIYKSQLLKDLGHSPKEKEQDFNTTKAISESVHYFIEEDPIRVEKIKADIQSYLQNLERLSLNDQLINKVRTSTPLFSGMFSLFYMLLGFPFFIFGFVNNYLPFKIPGWLAGVISKQKEFYGAISLSAGTFTFLIFYSFQIWMMDKLFHSWALTLTYSLLLPLSGLFAYYYYKRFTTIRGNWKVFSLFFKKTTLITSLVSKREAIIKELESGRKDFVNHRDGGISEERKNKFDSGEECYEFFNLNG